MDPLLRWYEKSHRQLPWRGQVTAYEVLVSEFMLQQTRVTAALPFYERFLARFPTIEALAAAEESEVLAVWQGLGYYARARNLLASARIIARDGLPTAVEGFRALPGVGDYSAAALGGRLLGLPTPSIDGNVERVVARLFGLEGLPAKNPTRSEIRRLATERIDRKRPGDWNQAMMELGATVCLPGEPRCSVCPLAGGCRALAMRATDRIPAREPSKKPVRQDHVCAVVSCNGSMLLRQIPPGGWWAGLWEFPRVVREAKEGVLSAAGRAAGVSLNGHHKALSVVRHSVTHYVISLHPVLLMLEDPHPNPPPQAGEGVFGGARDATGLLTESQVCRIRPHPNPPPQAGEGVNRRPQAEEGVKWVAVEELEDIAMPAPQRKVAEEAIRVLASTAPRKSRKSP